MKKKICFGILILSFLILTGSFGFGYVNIVGPSDLKLDSIQPGAGGNSTSILDILIIEANENFQITFNTTGDLKREELDKTGSGLGRYDTLETIILNLRVHGSNVFDWNGNMNNLDGLTTPTIIPDANEKIWMDINIQEGRPGPNYGKDNTWYESSDAGIYLSIITMTLVAIEQSPRPSLEFIPGDAQGSSPRYCIQIRNTGSEPKDDAKNVEVAITVVKGSGYVFYIEYIPIVGDIGDGQSKILCFAIHTNLAWHTASPGTEIKILIEVTREDNWSSHNVGKLAHYTLVK